MRALRLSAVLVVVAGALVSVAAGGEPARADSTDLGGRFVPITPGRVVNAGFPSGSGFSGNSEAHELTHNLGGVNPHAPHGTSWFHCWDEHDDMCYDDTPPYDGSVRTLAGMHDIVIRTDCPAFPFENRLDCHHDDFFNSRHRLTGYLAANWNVADSRFLQGPR